MERKTYNELEEKWVNNRTKSPSPMHLAYNRIQRKTNNNNGTKNDAEKEWRNGAE